MIDDNQALIEALEREILADALEKDLGLIRLTCAQMIAPRRLNQQVDRLLTYWGYRYQFECKKEVKKAVGYKSWLGSLVKSKNGANNVHSEYVFIIDDERYSKINSAISRMPPYYKAFVHMHYEIPSESEKNPLRYRNGRTVTEFVRYLIEQNKKNKIKSNLSIASYNEDLNEAKIASVALGII